MLTVSNEITVFFILSEAATKLEKCHNFLLTVTSCHFKILFKMNNIYQFTNFSFCFEDVNSYTSFDQLIKDLKPQQQTALESIVQGDVIAIQPTGYGKSLTYELLPFHHFKQTNEPAVVLILEPLDVIIEQQTLKLKDFSYFLKNNSSFSNH